MWRRQRRKSNTSNTHPSYKPPPGTINTTLSSSCTSTNNDEANHQTNSNCIPGITTPTSVGAVAGPICSSVSLISGNIDGKTTTITCHREEEPQFNHQHQPEQEQEPSQHSTTMMTSNNNNRKSVMTTLLKSGVLSRSNNHISMFDEDSESFHTKNKHKSRSLEFAIDDNNNLNNTNSTSATTTTTASPPSLEMLDISSASNGFEISGPDHHRFFRRNATNESTASSTTRTGRRLRPSFLQRNTSNAGEGDYYSRGGGGGGRRRRSSAFSPKSAAAKAIAEAAEAAALPVCDIAQLESYIDEKTMAYVAAQSPQQQSSSNNNNNSSGWKTSSSISSNEIKLGKLISEGDFTKSNEIKGFKFSKQRLLGSGGDNNYPLFGHTADAESSSTDPFIKPYYSIKTISNKIHDQTCLQNLEVANVSEAYQVAKKRLVTEILYLASLTTEKSKRQQQSQQRRSSGGSGSSGNDCGDGNGGSAFILSFRGYWISGGGGAAAGGGGGSSESQHSSREFQPEQPLDAYGIHANPLSYCLHLITDRLGETLEDRMKTWKSHRQRRQQEDTAAKFILESVQTDLRDPATTNLNMHKSKKPKGGRSSSIPLYDPTEHLSKSRHKSKHLSQILPLMEQYPDDLVALQTNYILQIAHALEYLHDRGIVIRDLRPNTIGFKEYPYHHTIQLFHFGHAKEVPTTTTTTTKAATTTKGGDDSGGEGLIEPEFIRALQGGHLSLSYHQTASGGGDGGGGDQSEHFQSHIRRNLSKQQDNCGGRSPRADAKHYRAPESYPFVKPPEKYRRGSGSSGGGGGGVGIVASGMDDTVHRVHTGGTTVTKNYNNITCSTKTLARNNTPPPSPPSSSSAFLQGGAEEEAGGGGGGGGAGCYEYKGYNCKADIYSLMMIYYEMLAESKPFGRNIITREAHYYRVQSHGLRPSLNKHHFPRTIKAVLEGGWNPVLKERYSAKQVRQLLTTILPMLEGKGLPLKKSHQLGRTNTGGTGSTPSTSSGGGGGNSSSGSNPSSTNPRGSHNNNLDHQVGISLPARAQALLVPHGVDNNGWQSVWSRTGGTKRLDPHQVMETIQAHRIGQAKKKYQPNKKQSKSPSMTSLPKAAIRMVRSTTIKDIIPFSSTKMVKSAINDETSKQLLGETKFNEKKRRIANSEALKKAYNY